MAAIGMVVLIMLLNLVVIGLTLEVGRDHELTVRRIETIAALYAAEAGVNMSIRERFTMIDEDGDGTPGTISDDGDPGNDPSLGGRAVFSVQASTDDPQEGQLTLTSLGRAGSSRRQLTVVLE